MAERGHPAKRVFLQPEGENPIRLSRVVNVLLVAALVAGVVFFSVSRLSYRFDWSFLAGYAEKIQRGFQATLLISLFSLFFAAAIGVAAALALQGRILFFKYLARLYIEVVRGTPFLVQIIFAYYIIATAFGFGDKYVLAVLILSVFSGSYITEIIRGGMQSVQESQWMSARSLGMSRTQIYRHVVFPQVMRRILPALAGQLSSLIKDSSLLSVIAVSELTQNILEIDSITFRTFEDLAFLAAGYLVITLPISLASKYLERKFAYEA